MPRFFTSFILTFRLKHTATQSKVLGVLRASLESASVELPLLRRRVFAIPATEKNRTDGRLEAREDCYWKPTVEANDLSEKWPSYDELMDDGLPQDLLDGALLMPSGGGNIDLQAGTPLLITQVNFVRGGILLGVGMFHSLVDGMSAALIFRMWAKHARIQQSETPDLFQIPSSCCDYNSLVDIWKASGSPIARGTDEDWLLLGLLPPGSHENTKKEPPAMVTSVFYFSAESLIRLAAIAAAAKDDNEDITPTANDAVMALLWRCQLRARQGASSEACYHGQGAVAELSTTLNGRGIFGETLPWQYLGTLIFLVTTRMPVAQLIASSTSLASIVKSIRHSVASVSRERALETYGLAATQLAGYSAETLRWPFATFDGAGACFTSWLSLPVLDMAFGGEVFANGGVPEYIRLVRRFFDLVCRNTVVLPLRPEGSAEVSVSMTVDEMALLEADPEFAEFAQLVCH